MVSFANKKISAKEGLGELLKQARQQADLTVEELAVKSLVPKKYLIALEEGSYWELPGEVYAEQFLRAYLKALSIKNDIFFERFAKEFNLFKNWKKRSQRTEPIAHQAAPRFVIGPWLLKRAVWGLLVLAFFAYLGWEVNRLIGPPELRIDSPADNLITSRQVVEAAGWVEPESRLLINGQEVYTDRQGNFSEHLGLQPGVNLITISAKKKYSKEQLEVRKVMVQLAEAIGRTF